jgi:hypothetical protein
MDDIIFKKFNLQTFEGQTKMSKNPLQKTYKQGNANPYEKPFS